MRNDLPLLKKRLEGYAATTIKVGPSTAVRKDGESNASLGEIHELNLNDWGYRSFLKMPLEYRLGDLLYGFHLDEEMLWDDPNAFPRALGKLALVAIDEAFETGGWGFWAPLTGYTVADKEARGSANPEQILVDTGALRASITFELTKA